MLDGVRDFSDFDDIGQAIHEGLVIGSNVTPGKLVTRWPLLADHVTNLIDEIALRSGDLSVRRAIWEDLAIRFLPLDSSEAGLVAGSVLICCAPFQLFRGVMRPPAHVDCLILQIGKRRRLQIPIVGSSTPSD